jgi:hypothetical protein
MFIESLPFLFSHFSSIARRDGLSVDCDAFKRIGRFDDLETTGGDLHVGRQTLLVFHIAETEETLTKDGLQKDRRKSNEEQRTAKTVSSCRAPAQLRAG